MVYEMVLPIVLPTLIAMLYPPVFGRIELTNFGYSTRLGQEVCPGRCQEARSGYRHAEGVQQAESDGNSWELGTVGKGSPSSPGASWS